MSVTIEIPLDSPLQAAIAKEARWAGLAENVLVLNILRERLHLTSEKMELYPDSPAARLHPDIKPRDEWEAKLLSIAADCGVSMTDEQLSREFIYED